MHLYTVSVFLLLLRIASPRSIDGLKSSISSCAVTCFEKVYSTSGCGAGESGCLCEVAREARLCIGVNCEEVDGRSKAC